MQNGRNHTQHPPLSSSNEERWIPAGSFVLVLPLRSFLVAAIQVIAASSTRPRLVVRLLQTLQPPSQRWSPPSRQRMASASHSRRPTGCRIAAAGVTRGGALHGARARVDRAYRDWEGAIAVLWEDNYEAILEKQAACARRPPRGGFPPPTAPR